MMMMMMMNAAINDRRYGLHVWLGKTSVVAVNVECTGCSSNRF